MPREFAKWTAIGGVLAALAICSACLLPAILIGLGVTGASRNTAPGKSIRIGLWAGVAIGFAGLLFEWV